MNEGTPVESSLTPNDSPIKFQDGLEPMENSNNDHSRNNSAVSQDEELDWAQIAYAFNYKRLMFILSYRTWDDFHTANGQKYIKYGSEELCHRFLQRILPNINEYELNDDELHLLALLEISPNFRRTESGFDMLEHDGSPRHESAVRIFTKHGGFVQDTRFDNASVDANNQIVITSLEENPFRPKFQLNEENATLLSVVLSSDEDLASCNLLSKEELHKRLKAAKNSFEINGQQLENINIPVDDLIKKLIIINDLKTAVNELVDQSFQNSKN